MRRKITLFILLVLGSSSFIFAQSVKISGRVTDQSGLPLPGVSVTIKETGIGTSTDVKGQYQISTLPKATLTFTFLGFETQNIAVNGRAIIDVILADGTKNLNEVVVVGYGTQKQYKVSGAIATIKSADIRAA